MFKNVRQSLIRDSDLLAETIFESFHLAARVVEAVLISSAARQQPRMTGAGLKPTFAEGNHISENGFHSR